MSNHTLPRAAEKTRGNFRILAAICLGLLICGTASSGLAATEDAPLVKLHEACRLSDFESLPANGADLKSLSAGPSRKAALHWAVEGMANRAEERLKVVQWLLDHGADIHQLSGDGLTPLQHACRDGWDRPLFNLLLARGANINASGKSTSQGPNIGTPLYRAAERRDAGLITYLLEKKADLKAGASPSGDTPLHAVFSRASSVVSEKARAKALSCAKLLLDAGSDPNAKNRLEWTPLHQAADAGHFEAVKELISRGALTTARTRSGMSALHCAVMDGPKYERKIVELLTSRDASLLNAPDHQGDTPLHTAVFRGNNQAIQSLLLLKADPRIRNKANQRPIDRANSDTIDQATYDMLDRYTPAAQPPERKPFDPTVI